MRSLISGSAGRTGALLVFFAGCALVMWTLFSGTGVRTPVVDAGEYEMEVVLDDVDNLVVAGRVQIAGVSVGEVRGVEEDPDGLRVTFSVDDDIAPLHEGVSVRLGERSLVGESYLDLVDGEGADMESGSTLPQSAVVPSVQLHDVLRSVDPDTRKELSSLIRSAGAATDGSARDLSQLTKGLGDLGRDGYTALDAIAAQSEDLRTLVGQTADLMRALDAGNGQIEELVSSANAITTATAGQSESVEQTLRMAPNVMGTARTASGSLRSLAGALAPVAIDLKQAAPGLTTALRELPATTRDLNGLLDPLSRTLDQAPGTLKRVPQFSQDVSDIVPTAQVTLSDLNPMLEYIKPYGPELSAYFANFNAVLNYEDENGANYLRLVPMINDYSVQSPVQVGGLGGILGTYTNAYPRPGTGATPGPFTGRYPRVERDR
jgi:phospholipid/cholesterol/gamma-HCH transport system substrate-binding protein